MDKNAIKKYAVWARRELIERVSQRAMIYGITAKDAGDPNAESVNGHLLSQAEKRQRQALIRNIKTKGYEQVMEEVAYTWFNRFAALRFMEVNGYLPSHIRVFTNDAGEFKPQILAEAIHLELNGLDMNKVYELESANKSEELFKYLLIVQCNALNSILPGMFQRIEDYTELLLPDYLLREGSVIEQMVTTIPEEDWTDQVQIIGWLYQYYISEKKDDVFAALKKNIKVSKENIPAATQLFTPDWIVQYMVQNSLGRLWLEGHPNDTLKTTWKYYLDEAEQEPEVQAQLDAIRKEYAARKPEDIRVIDPCCGSGHILCVLFDVLVQIYEDYGYTAREAAQSIVRYNLHGLDIDPRAAQLSYFAVMMKARQYDRRFFTRNIMPMVYAPEGYPEGLEYGSLITVDELEPAPDYDNWNLFDGDYALAQNRWNFRCLLSRQYDVVVTNPPYMGSSNMSATLGDYLKAEYPDSKSDLFAAFIERGNEMINAGGYNSMVTMQSWMFLTSFEKMRTKMLSAFDITNLMHMENMVLGIAFGTAVTVFRRTRIHGYKGTYNHIKLQDIRNEQPKEFPVQGNRFAQVSTDNFAKIPGAPVAYWVSKAISSLFDSFPEINNFGRPLQGSITGDNNRFLRLWFEVNTNRIKFDCQTEQDTLGAKWFPHSKGGEYRKWYGNREYIINWENEGFEIKHFVDTSGKLKSRPQNIQHFFKEGITWSDLTMGGFSSRYVDAGFTFNVTGPTFVPFDSCVIPEMIAYFNSKVFQTLLDICCPGLHYHNGIIAILPALLAGDTPSELANKCILLSKSDWDSFETSWDFQRHPLVQTGTASVAEAYVRWESECDARFTRLKSNEEELNRIFIDIYGLQDELTPEVADKDVTVRRADLKRDIKSLISYAVGCMFGRYSLSQDGLAFAGGEWDDNKYPATFKPDQDNILPICDDEYFEDDIVGRFVKFIEVVFGKETLEENLRFIADALGGKGSSRDVIRDYFLNDFYKDHCATYSVTGSGKRPIYWLFDSGKKNGFKCLIYMHRYQPDTIARIRTDYVHEQQSRYRTAIADLEQRINGASTSERVKLSKQLATLQAQAEEIRVYEEKIHHLADQMIKIDLDDGVKHNYEIFKDVLAKIK